MTIKLYLSKLISIFKTLELRSNHVEQSANSELTVRLNDILFVYEISCLQPNCKFTQNITIHDHMYSPIETTTATTAIEKNIILNASLLQCHLQFYDD